MTKPEPDASLRVRRLRLRPLEPLDGALELMFFALKGMTREADEVMAVHGLSRSHHRVLFIVARLDGITVGELVAMLGVSKQALHGPLRELLGAGYVAAERDPARHRYKLLRLTDAGRALERAASDRERAVMEAAFAAVPDAVDSWVAIMENIASSA